MKKVYNSKMNSTYFCWPERNAELHLSTKSSLNRTQSLKGRKSLNYVLPQPQSSKTKHAPLITSTSPGNYKNPPRIKANPRKVKVDRCKVQSFQ